MKIINVLANPYNEEFKKIFDLSDEDIENQKYFDLFCDCDYLVIDKKIIPFIEANNNYFYFSDGEDDEIRKYLKMFNEGKFKPFDYGPIQLFIGAFDDKEKEKQLKEKIKKSKVYIKYRGGVGYVYTFYFLD